MVGTTPKTYFRLGYGFRAAQRRPQHACGALHSVGHGRVAARGRRRLHNNGAIYHWNKSLIEGLDVADPTVRVLDQCRIGPVLTGDQDDLKGGAPIAALFIQNMNPVQVAPEQRKVKAGFAREDLFTCVHEQFMTATAKMADVVLPATMFLEHDDVYQGGGHQYITLGPKLLEPPGECWSNHDVICALAKRVGAEHPGFTKSSARDHRLDAAEVRLGHAGRAGREEVDRLPAGVRQGALHQGFQLSRQEVPLQTRLAEYSCAAQQRHPHRARGSAPARPLERDRECGRQTPVPALDQPLARLSQLVLQRDADQPGAARQAARQDSSRRSGKARHRRRRARAHGQRARRDRAGRRNLSGRAARRRHR